MPDFETKPTEHSNQKVKYLTDRQVSELTGIALQTLRNYRSVCKGPPYIKLNKSVRYLLADVIACMEQRRIVPEVSGGNERARHE